MVIDTSALICILAAESEAQIMAEAIQADSSRLLSSASLLEATIVSEARGGRTLGADLDDLIDHIITEIYAVDSQQVELARNAWRRFGKGRHKASLNFGDCFSYALAKATDEPLLFKGNDFIHTDLEFVLQPSSPL